MTATAVTAYSQRRADTEVRRVRHAAETASISGTVILDTAFGAGNEIGTELGVSAERVTITSESTEPCITIRTTYIVATRMTSFLIQNGSLTPIDRC